MQNFTAILNMKMALCILVVCAPRAALAEERGGGKWSVGAGMMMNSSPFAAEGTSVTPIPYVAYESEGLFLQGIEGGYHITASAEEKKAGFFLDVVGSGRFRAGETRQKFTVDLGLRAGMRSDFGVFDVTFLQDVTGTSNGQEVIGAYSYTFHDQRYKWIFTPRVGMSWMSRKMANYVWGVTQGQHNKMVADNVENSDKPVLPVYEPGAAVMNYFAGATLVHRLDDHWSAFALSQVTRLDRKITDNPGIDKDYDLTLGMGVSYSF
ncbi:MipA/OmpV family protein [Paremcibacter congregatus]|uniref:MipA/OmpV family protein n=1 Tax=Paremcibacter congregatus TaxID=2043170 RepID=UPI003A94F65F